MQRGGLAFAGLALALAACGHLRTSSDPSRLVMVERTFVALDPPSAPRWPV